MIQKYLLTPILLVTTALCSSLLINQVSADSNLRTQLEKLKVNDDLVSKSLSLLKLEVRNREVKPGESVLVDKIFKDFALQGRFSSSAIDPNSRYALLVLDLDFENANQTQPYNMLFSVNLQGHSIATGQTITVLDVPPIECKASKTNRIALIAFQQDNEIDILDVASLHAPARSPKRYLNIKNLVNKHGLTPVAANVFSALGQMDGVCSSTPGLLSSLNTTTLATLSILTLVWSVINKMVFASSSHKA